MRQHGGCEGGHVADVGDFDDVGGPEGVFEYDVLGVDCMRDVQDLR